MGHDHDHDHDHDLRSSSRKKVFIVFIITASYMLVEAVGGWWSGSLALLGDAGHMLTDAGALGLALFAFWLSAKPPSPQRTFGLHRAEILAAMANGIVLLVVAALVIREGLHRLADPQEIKGTGMLLIAVVGLGINILGAYILLGGDRDNLNLRGALFHVAGDALGSVGAIVAALLIIFMGWTKADPIVSFAIAIIIIIGALKLVGDAVHIVLEATPRNIDLVEVEKAMMEHPAVAVVHDLHVWTITSGFIALSAHVVVECGEGEDLSLNDTDILLKEVGDVLKDKFGVTHSTIQVEMEPCATECCDTCPPDEDATCKLPDGGH